MIKVRTGSLTYNLIRRFRMTEYDVSLNVLTVPLVDVLVADAERLRLGLERLDNGCLVVDGGIDALGGLEAGRRIAQICLGGLGRVSLRGDLRVGGPLGDWPLGVEVSTSDPVLACLGSQYAGWGLSHGEGKGAFQALGSGPARAVLVLEVDRRPPAPLVEKIARDCGIAPNGLTLTRSLAGTMQIVALGLEVALHKAYTLCFDLHAIRDGFGSAPLPPPAPDFVTAMSSSPAPMRPRRTWRTAAERRVARLRPVVRGGLQCLQL